MPFNFSLKRKNIQDNQTALFANKRVAEELIRILPGINDHNGVNFKFYFKNLRVEDLDSEYPEKHFQLLGDIDNFTFLLNFWKDWIDIELGKEQDIVGLFNRIRLLSAEIIKHDFLIEDPIEDTMWDLERGLEINKIEYVKWCGLVNHVEDIVRKKK